MVKYRRLKCCQQQFWAQNNWANLLRMFNSYIKLQPNLCSLELHEQLVKSV